MGRSDLYKWQMEELGALSPAQPPEVRVHQGPRPCLLLLALLALSPGDLTQPQGFELGLSASVWFLKNQVSPGLVDSRYTGHVHSALSRHLELSVSTMGFLAFLPIRDVLQPSPQPPIRPARCSRQAPARSPWHLPFLHLHTPHLIQALGMLLAESTHSSLGLRGHHPRSGHRDMSLWSPQQPQRPSRSYSIAPLPERVLWKPRTVSVDTVTGNS